MNATRAATIRGRACGRRRRLARPRADADAGADGPARARRSRRSCPSRTGSSTRSSTPRYEGLWFEGDETRLKDGEARRGDRGEGRRGAATAVVESVERKEQSERAPLLYDLTSLQRDANRRFGFSARRTLAAAQSLYEEQKALTYPRTNSRYLSGDMIPRAQADRRARSAADRRVRARPRATCSGCDAAAARRAWSTTRRSPTTTRSSRPTSSTTSSRFSPDERRIYDLVARRFLAVFHPPARVRAHDGRRPLVEERALPHARQGHARGRLARRLRRAPRPTQAARGRTRTTRTRARAAAARAGRGGQVRDGRGRGARRPSRRRATPRRRCSPRWRPPAS